ncbi:MAG TPA: nitroreductase/quinone reductase family protein [Acidimicrobiia bacterium]|nr:nitroreductase/quinone reductase family protein [Acidimicrobiia bacterium]
MHRLKEMWRWALSPDRPFREKGMYRSGRPNRMARVMNRLGAWVGNAGLWRNRLVTLEVPGRRSGKVVSFPLVVARHQGELYLVSMLGEDANWVANVRAVGGHVVLVRGSRQAVHLEEVDPSLSAPILKRYLQVAPGARAHIPVDQHAPLAEFERIAPHYPVFGVNTDRVSQEIKQ